MLLGSSRDTVREGDKFIHRCVYTAQPRSAPFVLRTCVTANEYVCDSYDQLCNSFAQSIQTCSFSFSLDVKSSTCDWPSFSTIRLESLLWYSDQVGEC